MKKPIYLRRPRIEKELQKIFEKPLYIVSAPAGYGKTVAVNRFLRAQRIQTIWLNCEPEDSNQLLWKRLTDQVSAFNKDFGNQLRQLGYPNDAYARDHIINLLLSLEIGRPVVIVLDDFQNNNDKSISALLYAIAKEQIEKLHFVLITRDLGKINYWDYFSRDLCYLLSGNTLRFSLPEIVAYAKLINIELTEKTAREIYDDSQGWISLVYLMLRHMQQNNSLGRDASIDDMIEKTIFNPMDEKSKKTWLKLSILDSFTIGMALYVLEDNSLVNLPEQLFKDNALLDYNPFTKTYTIHSIFKDFLRERAALGQVDCKRIYSRAGHWCLQSGDVLNAFDYLFKAGEIEAILAEMNKEDLPEIHFIQYEKIYRIFENLDDGLWKKYPLAFLHYLRPRLVSGNAKVRQKGEWLLKKMEDYFLNADCDEQFRNFILAEIYIIWHFAVFNDIEKMIMYNKTAAKYLNGNCSCIVTRNKEATFGSPHFLYLYNREPGKLRKTTDLIIDNYFRFALVSNGCGSGCDSLAAAEYNLETGNLDNVEMFAYKAIYKAKADEQLSVVICAVFTLLRYAIYAGRLIEYKKMFDGLRQEVECENDPVLNTAFDMCNAYINCCLQRTHALPKWLREGELSYGYFMFDGVAFKYLVYEKCLLLMGEFLKLDALCEMFPNYNIHYKNQLGVLHNCIHEAIAKSRLQGLATGQKILVKALTMGQKDGIIMPFAENAVYLLDMLHDIAGKGEFAYPDYLNQVIYHSEKYKESVQQLELDKEILSPRETEVLKLLAQGLKHSEIAEQLFISTTTVRFHIKNIYTKLGVNNKVSMLRKARKLLLID